MDFGQNLEALLNGYELNTYQKTLAKQEFECWKEEYVRMASELSKLRQDAVMMSFDDIKNGILKHKAKSEYKQASIVIVRDVFKSNAS